MKQYRLKKDLPGLKAGAIFSWNEVQNGYRHDINSNNFYAFRQEEVDSFSEWFEPVRWVPRPGEKYYFVDTTGEVEQEGWMCHRTDGERLDFGNCFKTASEAEAARDKVKELLLSL